MDFQIYMLGGYKIKDYRTVIVCVMVRGSVRVRVRISLVLWSG